MASSAAPSSALKSKGADASYADGLLHLTPPKKASSE
jgi:HSP20 family molecular chaperone IbpA